VINEGSEVEQLQGR